MPKPEKIIPYRTWEGDQALLQRVGRKKLSCPLCTFRAKNTNLLYYHTRKTHGYTGYRMGDKTRYEPVNKEITEASQYYSTELYNTLEMGAEYILKMCRSTVQDFTQEFPHGGDVSVFVLLNSSLMPSGRLAMVEMWRAFLAGIFLVGFTTDELTVDVFSEQIKYAGKNTEDVELVYMRRGMTNLEAETREYLIVSALGGPREGLTHRDDLTFHGDKKWTDALIDVLAVDTLYAGFKEYVQVLKDVSVVPPKKKQKTEEEDEESQDNALDDADEYEHYEVEEVIEEADDE